MRAVNHIGFISTRFCGTDGVSLETKKWVKVLSDLGYESYFFAGESDWPEERSYTVAEAHFDHPDIRGINTDLFDDYQRSQDTSTKIELIKRKLKSHLYQFVKKFNTRLLIVENALALPMNIPLGLAITELIAETEIPTIAHHHDFAWERTRFSISAAEDYLQAAFPPTLRHIQHVVINSFAERQLALRTGLSAMLIPNVMDFDGGSPLETDEYSKDLRQSLGIPGGSFLLLQPTRIVPRKRIEHAIELTRRLGEKAVLVISHHGGDEGQDYDRYLHEYANILNVPVKFAAEFFAVHRETTRDGRKIYSLADAYSQADLVTYPSQVEGFGNAFLEAIYYRRPIVLNNYEIFKTDIRPKGFKVIGYDNYIDRACIAAVQKILAEPRLVDEMVSANYQIARKFYSYQVLERRLASLLELFQGDY
jgi:glycosyltransferase involved in cell wall biosynthesis